MNSENKEKNSVLVTMIVTKRRRGVQEAPNGARIIQDKKEVRIA
jgi:hypothetical protein